MRAKSKSPLRELQDRRLLAEHRRVSSLFAVAQKRWLRAAAPSLALRQLTAVGNLLTKYVEKG